MTVRAMRTARTITISVTDNGGPQFVRVSGELNGVTREVTSFATPPLLSLGTKKEDGTEKVTFTVEGRDNSGAAPHPAQCHGGGECR